MALNDGFITVKTDDGKAVIKASAITAVTTVLAADKSYYTTLIHLQGTYMGCNNELIEDVVKRWQEALAKETTECK